MSSLNSAEFFNILSLPTVVSTHLFGFLDRNDILNCRNTCKGLKEIADQPSVLQNVRVKVTCGKRLRTILESRNVPFNNFLLCFRSLEDQFRLEDFGHVFGSSIRKLTITSCGGHATTLKLLEKCTQLVVLELASIDFGILRSPEHSAAYTTILKNLRNVKRLVLNESRRSPMGAGMEIKTFLQILGACRVLEEFKIPNFPDYNMKLITRVFPDAIVPPDDDPADDGWEDDWEVQPFAMGDPMPEWTNLENGYDVLVHPVIEYITQRDSSSSQKRGIRSINVQEIVSFGSSAFLDLAKTCHRRNIKLISAYSSQFLHIKDEVASMEVEYFDIFESVSVMGLHKGFPLYKMSNLTTINLEICDSSDLTSVPTDSSLWKFPKLRCLRVQFMFAVNEVKNGPLIKNIFQERERPSVEKLDLSWHLHEPSTTIRVLDLGRNFQNVKHLEIRGWDATDDDFMLLWPSLLFLETVSIKDCRNLGDRGFIGDFDIRQNSNIPQRPLIRLKRLRSLSIRDLFGKVTQTSLIGCFRWIPLQHFYFESSTLKSIPVQTYHAMRNTPFGNSIQSFYGPKPQPYRKIGRYFYPNLKRPLEEV